MAKTKVKDTELLDESKERLERLSSDRLRVAADFLAYLEEREENEATQELLDIDGFYEAFQEVTQQVQAGDVVRWEDIRR